MSAAPAAPAGGSAARTFLAAGAFLVALATIAGAFGTHALRARLPAAQLATWQTAVEYQFFHALGLMLIGVIARGTPARLLTAAGWCILAGILLFCGSLYGLAGLQLAWLGPVTPLGGVALIAGWVLCGTNVARVASR